MADATEVRRLRIVPTLLFSLLAVAFLVLAMPDGAASDSPYPLLEAAASLGGVFLLAPALAILAFLFRFSSPLIWAILLPLSVLLTFLRLHDFFLAAMAAVLFLPALALHLTLRRGVPRTTAVCMISGLLLVIFAGVGFITLGKAVPGVSPAEWLAMAEKETVELLCSLQTVNNGKTYAYFGVEQAGEVAALMISLLPGLCVLFCNLVAWLTHTCALLIYRLHGLGKLLPVQTVVMTASVPAAILFTVACLLSVVTAFSDDWLMVTAVSDNLILIFEPLLAYIGGLSVAAFWHKRGASRTTLILLTLTVLFFCDPSIFLLILAFVGVVRTLKKLKTKEKR
ncbi:MAG: hypothetical protein IKL84_05080 [Clostridia bacterium]|nr:hypothetical protein [Clostridia bacterium]